MSALSPTTCGAPGTRYTRRTCSTDARSRASIGAGLYRRDWVRRDAGARCSRRRRTALRARLRRILVRRATGAEARTNTAPSPRSTVLLPLPSRSAARKVLWTMAGRRAGPDPRHGQGPPQYSSARAISMPPPRDRGKGRGCRSFSCTPAISTTLLTARSRLTTPTRPHCSPDGYLRSWTASDRWLP